MSTPKRPMPPEFPDFARGKIARDIKAHYGLGSGTYERWMKEAGLYEVRPRSSQERSRLVPADFAEHASVEPNHKLAKRYHAALRTINAWRQEAGIPKPEIPPAHMKLRPVPADFMKVAPTMCRNQLERHYRTGDTTLRRWIRETGVKTLVPTPGRKPKFTRPPASDISCAGKAAAHLRRYYSPVFRAEILPDAERKQLPNKGKDFFVVGAKGAMPAAEMIALAERRGFDARAWARI